MQIRSVETLKNLVGQRPLCPFLDCLQIQTSGYFQEQLQTPPSPPVQSSRLAGGANKRTVRLFLRVWGFVERRQDFARMLATLGRAFVMSIFQEWMPSFFFFWGEGECCWRTKYALMPPGGRSGLASGVLPRVAARWDRGVSAIARGVFLDVYPADVLCIYETPVLHRPPL